MLHFCKLWLNNCTLCKEESISDLNSDIYCDIIISKDYILVRTHKRDNRMIHQNLRQFEHTCGR